MPTPLGFPVTNGSNSRARTWAETPGPLSFTRTSATDPRRPTYTATLGADR